MELTSPSVMTLQEPPCLWSASVSASSAPMNPSPPQEYSPQIFALVYKIIHKL